MKVVAQHLGQNIKIKDLQKNLVMDVLLKDPLLIQHGHEKYIVVFRYGVIVGFGISAKDIESFRGKISPYMGETFKEIFTEEVEIEKTEGEESITTDYFKLKGELDTRKIILIAEALSRSVALDAFEHEADNILQQFNEVTESLSKNGKTHFSSNSLLKRVGFAMKIQNLIVGQMAMLDKPDITWNDNTLYEFYSNLSAEYEIDERYKVVYQKLDMIFRDIEFIMNYIEGRRSFFVEVIIVVLILVEIFIFIFETFFLG